MYNFEKLEIWQASVKFADEVYEITKSFPKEERFGLTNQLRKASTSISSNIAEGSARYHEKDFIRFLRIALGSVFECVTQLYIALNQKYIKQKEFQVLYDKTTSISMMLNKFISSLQSRLKTNTEQRTSNNEHES